MDMMEIRRRLLQFEALPPDYQRVEYIKSTGTQYIDVTDTFYTDKNFQIVCQSDYTTETQVIFGYGAEGGHWFGTVDGKYGLAGNSAGMFSYVDIEDKVTAIVWYTLDYIYAKIGETTKYQYRTSTIRRLTLFGGKGSSSFYGCSAKVFSFCIDGVCNLIPCYRKNDGAIGMYDTIGHRFLTNAGTGTFIKGSDV